MKKSYIFIMVAIFAAMSALVSCQKHAGGNSSTPEIPEEPEVPTNTPTVISGAISEAVDYNGLDIVSIGGEAEINNNSFQVSSYANDNVQTFAIADDDNNVYLLSRESLTGGSGITIDAQTTALALVTMHPLFSPVKADDYNTVKSIITESSKFDALLQEVEKSIAEKRDIFDVDNEELLIALSNLMEDISAVVNEEEFEGTLDDAITAYSNATRAIYDNPKVYPFHADITGNVLTLQNVGLSPSYYGTVLEANGRETPFSVPAREDYGGMDLFKKDANNFDLGEPRKFTFTTEGEYIFSLSRMNEAAQADFYFRLAKSLLSTIGLNLSKEIVKEAASTIGRVMINAGSGVNDTAIEPMAWLEIAYQGVLELMQQQYVELIGEVGIVRMGSIISKSLNLYNKIKGALNAGIRIGYSIAAPEEVNFCLCYYNNNVSTCSEAVLHEVSGNGQSGYYGQRLLLPLVVRVDRLAEDTYNENSFHRIKFEVVSGGGRVDNEIVSTNSNNQASTYWSLGLEGEQIVKATVVDIITGKEISDPVYFTANVDSADITIRLDWNKHSGRIDIDLHVIDPFGEKIYFAHMSSASGGYLDRDDVIGPGPEHIRWVDAPAGTYQVFVHYYGSESHAITNYKVSINANGINYQPHTGSIAYHQLIPIGQFTIGDSPADVPATRSISLDAPAETIPIDVNSLPKK